MPRSFWLLLVAVALDAAGPISAARGQIPARGLGLELHVGYGGGGLHQDELVGGGLGYRFGAHAEMAVFATAVVARPGGRAVFGGLGPRVLVPHGSLRLYLTAGALLAYRAYTPDHIGQFAGAGLEVVLDQSRRYWRVFAEGRVMRGGGSWSQVVGGVRCC